MKNPTFNELAQAILAVLPRATFDEDLEGQLVIYTDVSRTAQDPNAELSDFCVSEVAED
jgi:hypothetical protein